MKAAFKLENTDQVEATLSLTMRLGEWKRLLDQLPGDYPAWQVISEIRKMIREAEERYSMEHKDG